MHILNKSESLDQKEFDIVYGTVMGSIYHGAFYLQPRGNLIAT